MPEIHHIAFIRNKIFKIFIMPVVFLLNGLYSASAQQEVFLHGSGMAIPFMNHPTITVTVAEKKSPAQIIGQTLTDNQGNYSLKVTTTGIDKHLVNSDKNDLWIYPNPFSGKLNIEFYSPAQGDYQVELNDLSGRTFVKFRSSSEKGINILTIQNIRINGIVIIKITGKEKIWFGKALSTN